MSHFSGQPGQFLKMFNLWVGSQKCESEHFLLINKCQIEEFKQKDSIRTSFICVFQRLGSWICLKWASGFGWSQHKQPSRCKLAASFLLLIVHLLHRATINQSFWVCPCSCLMWTPPGGGQRHLPREQVHCGQPGELPL